MTIKITALVEDSNILDHNLESEHGLSFFLEYNNKKILFDTGSKKKYFLDNAKKLDLDISKIDYMVLSHGHYDHTGGVIDYIEHYGNNFNLIVHPDLFLNRFAIEKDSKRDIGNPFTKEDLYSKGVKINFIENMLELSDELYAITPFEADPEMPREKTVLFYEKNGDLYEDFNPGEVVLVIKGSKGLVILAGCSHIGVVSIIEKIKKLFNENIYAFIGGTHLKGESDTYIKKAAEYFKTSEIQKIGVCHCTGEAAEKIFNESLKERFFKVTTGSRIVL